MTIQKIHESKPTKDFSISRDSIICSNPLYLWILKNSDEDYSRYLESQSESAEVVDNDEMVSRIFKFLTPYPYQAEIFSQIENQWFGPDASTEDPYGSIVYLSTGSGKTMIAIMVILRMFEIYSDYIVHLNPEQTLSKHNFEVPNDETPMGNKPKKVGFVVPT